LKIADSFKCKSGFKVCKFMVPHRVGLKAVFGDTAVDNLAIWMDQWFSGSVVGASVFGTMRDSAG
jgi:hypothetical protein